MAIKLAVLKSGEQIIADIKEFVDENDKVVSLIFENSYTVRFLTPELLVEDLAESENREVTHKVSYSPWIVLSEDKLIPVPPDWVVTIVEPIEWVRKSYEEKMNKSLDGVQSKPKESNKTLEVSDKNIENLWEQSVTLMEENDG
jgi:hypothetical protein